MFNFVSLLKYKHQMTGNKLCVNLLRYAAQVYTMTGNKLCVNLLRYAAQVYTICYPSSDIYTSIN